MPFGGATSRGRWTAGPLLAAPPNTASRVSLPRVPGMGHGGRAMRASGRVSLSPAWPHASLLTSRHSDTPSAFLREAGANLRLSSPSLSPQPAQALSRQSGCVAASSRCLVPAACLPLPPKCKPRNAETVVWVFTDERSVNIC